MCVPSPTSGHHDCGAVRAATKRQDPGLLENWLRLIRDVYRIHKDYIDLIDVSRLSLPHSSLTVRPSDPLLTPIDTTTFFPPRQDEEMKHLTLVELNVVEQCLNLNKTGVVQRRRSEVREEMKAANPGTKIPQEDLYPRIHGLVFNPANGILKTLPVNFKQRVSSLECIE